MPPFPERESSILAKLKKKKGPSTVTDLEEAKRERSVDVNGGPEPAPASTSAVVGPPRPGTQCGQQGVYHTQALMWLRVVSGAGWLHSPVFLAVSCSSLCSVVTTCPAWSSSACCGALQRGWWRKVHLHGCAHVLLVSSFLCVAHWYAGGMGLSDIL